MENSITQIIKRENIKLKLHSTLHTSYLAEAQRKKILKLNIT